MVLPGHTASRLSPSPYPGAAVWQEDTTSQLALPLATNLQALETPTLPTPTPKPRASAAPLPAFPFQGRGVCVQRRAGSWGSRAEEGGRQHGTARHLCSGHGRRGFTTPLPRQPAGRTGFWKSCPLLPPLPSVPRGSLPRFMPSNHKRGFVFPRQTARFVPQPGPGLVCLAPILAAEEMAPLPRRGN